MTGLFASGRTRVRSRCGVGSPSGSVSRTVSQNSSCGVGPVSAFLPRIRDSRPPPIGSARLADPTDISTICHIRRSGLPIMKQTTVSISPSSVLVSSDSPVALRIACSRRAWVPASTARISTLNTVTAAARPTWRSRSWWISATRPISGPASVSTRSSSWASSTAAFANSWNSENATAWSIARNPAPIRLPSSPVK